MDKGPEKGRPGLEEIFLMGDWGFIIFWRGREPVKYEFLKVEDMFIMDVFRLDLCDVIFRVCECDICSEDCV